jgi:hypothetical protein
MAMLLLLLPVLAAHAQRSTATSGPRTADVPVNPEREAFFGDLHLHTGFSFDAAASGTETTPDDAYRYALGESVEYLGQTVRRNRPLDFLAVTDHAEYLGVALEAADPAGPFATTQWPERIGAVTENTLAYMRIFSASGFQGSAPAIPELSTEPVIRSNWQRTIDAAEAYYRPGSFTSLVAYEWSPMPGGAHLHRNVIFRGPEYPARPFSALDSLRPEDLWTYVEALEADGIASVLIPHNPNLSQGLMFAATDSDGEPITRAYAARRLANERLVEIAQNKGTSETRPEFATDEFAGFELLSLAAEANSDPAGGYLRPALGRGLEIEAGIGLNPFRFGLIGSSDFHSGISSTEESNFAGALGRSDDMRNPEMVLTEINPIAGAPAAVFSAGALTGVWAESNTRESIFAALDRREAFATSGTRIRPRLFAGFAYAEDLLDDPDWIAQAYAGGVPMGSDLTRRAETRSLKLVVHAIRDPAGANLDRIQIVKIWLDGDTAREAIFDVAWSDDRVPDTVTGELPAVGNSVDLATASVSSEIGAPQLGTVWTDPAFDPAVPAVYYARILEIPTPRWTTFLAVRHSLALPEAVPATIQERAWTSPVFYEP